MRNDDIREIWNKRAKIHAAQKCCKAQNVVGQLYHDSWWHYINPLLSEIPNGRILEAGCGTGRWAEHLAPRGFTLVMSDLSPAMLVKAKEYAEENGFVEHIDFKELDVCDLHSLEDNSFDMVISTGEPISICSDPRKAISEYCRVVRPGGFVLCDAGNKYRKAFDSFQAHPAQRFLHILETGDYASQSGMELHMLGPSELTAIFEEYGLTIKTMAGITPMGTFPACTHYENAVKDSAIRNELYELQRLYGEKPEIVALSSRILAVAQKPH
ncbi:MAG: class I SAM-dependent methyltransferase [Desulfovibrionaceae bacterium]